MPSSASDTPTEGMMHAQQQPNNNSNIIHNPFVGGGMRPLKKKTQVRQPFTAVDNPTIMPTPVIFDVDANSSGDPPSSHSLSPSPNPMYWSLEGGDLQQVRDDPSDHPQQASLAESKVDATAGNHPSAAPTATPTDAPAASKASSVTPLKTTPHPPKAAAQQRRGSTLSELDSLLVESNHNDQNNKSPSSQRRTRDWATGGVEDQEDLDRSHHLSPIKKRRMDHMQQQQLHLQQQQLHLQHNYHLQRQQQQQQQHQQYLMQQQQQQQMLQQQQQMYYPHGTYMDDEPYDDHEIINADDELDLNNLDGPLPLDLDTMELNNDANNNSSSGQQRPGSIMYPELNLSYRQDYHHEDNDEDHTKGEQKHVLNDPASPQDQQHQPDPPQHRQQRYPRQPQNNAAARGGAYSSLQQSRPRPRHSLKPSVPKHQQLHQLHPMMDGGHLGYASHGYMEPHGMYPHDEFVLYEPDMAPYYEDMIVSDNSMMGGGGEQMMTTSPQRRASSIASLGLSPGQGHAAAARRGLNPPGRSASLPPAGYGGVVAHPHHPGHYMNAYAMPGGGPRAVARSRAMGGGPRPLQRAGAGGRGYGISHSAPVSPFVQKRDVGARFHPSSPVASSAAQQQQRVVRYHRVNPASLPSPRVRKAFHIAPSSHEGSITDEEHQYFMTVPEGEPMMGHHHGANMSWGVPNNGGFDYSTSPQDDEEEGAIDRDGAIEDRWQRHNAAGEELVLQDEFPLDMRRGSIPAMKSSCPPGVGPDSYPPSPSNSCGGGKADAEADSNAKAHAVANAICKVKGPSKERKASRATPPASLKEVKAMLVDELEGPSSDFGDTPHFSLRDCMSLSVDEDGNWLSEFQTFVRKEFMEIFRASPEEVKNRNKSRSVSLHQLGIRCKFCAHLHPSKKVRRAAAYPSATAQIYQSFSMMIRDHFPKCEEVSKDKWEMFQKLKDQCNQGAADSKLYWQYAAEKQGMKDSEGGIFMDEASQRAASMKLPFCTSVEILSDVRDHPVLLVTPDDKALVSQFYFELMSRTQRVKLLDSELRSTRKNLKVGLPGIGCRYCCEAGRLGFSRVFPTKRKVMSEKASDMYKHMQRCTLCPREVKERLEFLLPEKKAVSAADRAFFDRVWMRLNH